MKKGNLYEVHVEDKHLCTTYFVKAPDARIAKAKAKEKFVKEFYNPRNVKSEIIDKEQHRNLPRRQKASKIPKDGL